MTNIDFKALTAEFPKDEIKFRVGPITKDRAKGKPLAYIDARLVMDRLDDVAGIENWQDKYTCTQDKTICHLSLRVGDEWITKGDGAGDTVVEGAKGGISDALKRAAVKWGIGRYLYHMDFKWMPLDQFKNLEGDPWDYIINKPKTTREKNAAAEEWVNSYLLKLDAVESQEGLMDLQQNNHSALYKLSENHPNLMTPITNKTQEKLTWLNSLTG